MKQLIILFLLAFCSTVSRAQNKIESFQGVDLNGKDHFIPGETKGKYTIVGFMASVEAQNDLIGWYEPIADNFEWDEEVNVYFTVLLGGMAQNNSNSMKEKMREVVLEEYYDNVIVFLGNVKSLMKSIGMKDDKTPYFCVLDPQGKIIYSCSGPYQEPKLDEMIIAIDGELENE